eukprot:m.19708 g.19708  ORF g.19708 m.19708 type:complete len:65 (+) comp5152_c0_seq1:410-604(+)
MSYWRTAGLTYVQFSSVAARMVRQALKPEAAKRAAARETGSINIRFLEKGKIVGNVPFSTKVAV